ncbi:MAG TPA: hypothetical protein VJB59_09900 [Bdellovibrionota bacterium]|nr:hypothetical protein [Bdellovibrionota bacterium]
MKTKIGVIFGFLTIPVALVVIYGCGKSTGTAPGGFYVPSASGPVIQQTAMQDRIFNLIDVFPRAYAFSVASGLSLSKDEIGTYDGGWQAGSFVFGNSGANSNSKGACMMVTSIRSMVATAGVVDGNLAEWRYLIANAGVITPTITADEMTSGKDLYFVPSEASGHEKNYKFKLRISTRPNGSFKQYEMWVCRDLSGTNRQDEYHYKQISGNTYTIRSHYATGGTIGGSRLRFSGTLADASKDQYSHRHAEFRKVTESGNKSLQIIFDQDYSKYAVEIQRGSDNTTSDPAEKRYGEATVVDGNDGVSAYANKMLAISAGVMSVGGTSYGWNTSMQSTAASSVNAGAASNVSGHSFSAFSTESDFSAADGSAWDCSVPSGYTTYTFSLPDADAASATEVNRFGNVGNEGGYYEPPTCAGLSQ